MQITRLGQSCLHIIDGDAKILIDPGSYSHDFESLTDLTAVLITHQHADHLDMTRVPGVLTANPQAAIYADAGSAPVLQEAGFRVTTVAAGDRFDVGTPVVVHVRDHAVIHADIPLIPNAAYLIGGRLLHPGDSFAVPDVPVEVLALPAAAPWMALKEAVDYYRAVAPSVAFPIHEKMLADTGMFFGRFAEMGPKSARWLVPAEGEPFEV